MSTSSNIIKQKTFWQQYGNLILILGGIIVGALIGAFAPSVGTTIKPVGDIFLNLLFTIVVPLVFVSIASAVGSMANMKRLGRILGGTIGTFIFTGLIAAACVLIWVNLFSPSAGTSIEMTSTEVGEAKTAAELIVSSLTVSDFSDLWDKSNMLPLIIFAILIGFCVSACGGDETPVGKLLINLNDIIMKFVGVIMTIAPLGLGAYFANLVATYGPEIIGDYGRSMLVYYPLCLLYGVSTLDAGATVATALSGTFHTPVAAYAFLVFILLYVPCVAAVSTMVREMGSLKWTARSILWQLAAAWLVSFVVFQVGMLLF